MNSVLKRIGKFLIREEEFDRNPDIRKFFGECFIIRAEHLYWQKGFEYVAYSEYFDELPENVEIPEYHIQITETGFVIQRIDYKTGIMYSTVTG